MADRRQCEAPDCRVRFTPERSTAKYCSATCRQRAARARKAVAAEAEVPADPDAGAGKSEHGLVRAVRKELLQAKALETVAGQLALQIARRIANPDEGGLSTLSKELRSLLAEAKGATAATPGPGVEEPAEPDDEVTLARKAREAKEAQAAAAAGES